MHLACTFGLFIAGIVASIAMELSIIWPMLLGAVLFAAYAVTHGHGVLAVLRMMLQGARKGLIVFFVFVLVGMLTAAWRASGTIPYFVFWGLRLIRPNWFLLSAFLMSACLSYLAGSSFGTIGTLGVVLMVLSRSGGVSPIITAGAIIGGSYFGDRGSPVSSSALLVSTLTETDLHHNVMRMLKTGALPLLASCVFYAVLSRLYPLSGRSSALYAEIASGFRLSPILMLPALVILVLPLLKCGIRTTMLSSLLISSLIAIFYQGMEPLALCKSLLLGYEPTFAGAFADLMRGGGLITMLKASLVVIIASTYAGIFQNTGMLALPEQKLRVLSHRIGLFPATLVTATAAAMLACNQTLAIMMTEQLMHKAASDVGATPEDCAQNLENSVITISPLIPWNIAVSVGLAVLEVGPAAILFACYLYFIPLGNLIDSLVHSMPPLRPRKKLGYR